ncbi:hypothetical protein Paride_0452 [Pseudomonas phage Paride]|nr:hypothetical protein Deiofobo_0449 [Pseudomonas phage Deifobo]WPK40167.1 hypothetical protein ETTORE_0458 [Pseudomonas phage Ettore]WPK40682.1 hypothetical protein Paride_0452 [Pseudomonas phage Paride]
MNGNGHSCLRLVLMKTLATNIAALFHHWILVVETIPIVPLL